MTLILAMVFLVPSASATTGWRNFGTAWATGLGDYGNPEVAVSSSTGRNPEAIRFVVAANPNIRTRVSWNLSCWNEDTSGYEYSSGSFTAMTPITRDVSRSVGVRNFERCDLRVSAYHMKNGRLDLQLQVQYP